MLHEFITRNREEIIARTRAKVAKRTTPPATEVELKNGIPMFLSQLAETLRLATSGSDDIEKSATLHGYDLLQRGFTIAQVVHDYGDVCQVVTELSAEMKASITSEEFHIFNRCLDDAIAQAVTEYARHRERSLLDQGTERLGHLAHEMRNILSTAMLSFEVIKRGSVGTGGSTAAMLSRNLMSLRNLIDRSLAEVRLEAGIRKLERISMAEIMEDVELDATIQAQAHGLHFSVTPVDRSVTVEADRTTLASAITNLLQNAFKFTHAHGHVALKTYTKTNRVLVEIEDECGGLPPGDPEEFFRPFEQRGPNRAGVGLGLSISRKAVDANGGVIRVRNLPGKGCVFTIELPSAVPPPP
jgi:signal transduction histidine kinase